MKNIEALKAQSPAAQYRAMVAQMQQRHAQSDGALRMTPSDFQRALAEASKIAVNGARDVQTLFAYSSIRLLFDSEDEDGTTTFSLDADLLRKFFQYGVDEQNNVQVFGGFPAGYVARYDDTNLTKAGKPPFGDMLITRMGLVVRGGAPSDTDPVAYNAVLAQSDLAISTNGSKNFKHVGSPAFWPGQMGMLGSSLDATGVSRGHQAIGSGQGPYWMRELDEPFLWKLDGGIDDDLCIQLTIDHPIEFSYTTADLDVSEVGVSLWCVVEGVSARHLSANG